MKPLFGNLTWKDVDFDNIFKRDEHRDRIIGLTFPPCNESLGLEPSVLSVLPAGNNVEYSLENKRFNDNNVQLYVCSVYISGMEEFTEWASQHDNNKIVVGGYHPTTFPEDFIGKAAKIVKGPCDDLFATIEQKGIIVPGIVNYKNIPRRDVYDVNKNSQIIPDLMPNQRVMSINTSMGCSTTPPCDFCCSPIMCNKVVSKPIDALRSELYDIVENHRPNPCFCFIRDENFTQQKDWIARLELISSYLRNTKLYMFASANTLTKEKLMIMKRNGVYMICLGLEDPTTDYKKNRTLDRVAGEMKEIGIYSYLSFIVNPLNIIGREAAESFYDVLIKRIKSLAPEMICGNFLMPFPGTGLWDEYYAFVDRSDYKYYDSKTPFLIKNKIVRKKMQFFMFWYQWLYYTSEFYNENVRIFAVGDTLHLRFEELYARFREEYELYWNVRA